MKTTDPQLGTFNRTLNYVVVLCMYITILNTYMKKDKKDLCKARCAPFLAYYSLIRHQDCLKLSFEYCIKPA